MMPGARTAEVGDPRLWTRLDALVATKTIRMDRPCGSRHPRIPARPLASVAVRESPVEKRKNPAS